MIITLLFLLPLINSYILYPSIKFSQNSNFNYLDPENIEKLEKLFYEKSKKYSPYKKIFYNKTDNSVENHNIKNITDYKLFINNYKEKVEQLMLG